jgi:beta-aspartyl-peptidase (threonine type)
MSADGRSTHAGSAVEPVLAVHGGAGRLPASRLEPAARAGYEAGLHDALAAGWQVLRAGGPATGAVVAAVCVLEDAPLFNAGRGSELCADGGVELSASLMRGADRAAGAVAVVRGLKNPIEGAHALLEHPHVLLVGPAADVFAREAGCAHVAPDYFVTSDRLREWQRRRDLDAEQTGTGGTVGAVARDAHGELAAATSTGGVSGQLPGRVGDSPVIGAGTWADSRTCAVSATGLGESFVRATFARRVADLMELACIDVDEASARALDEVGRLGGRGGCVVLSAHGRLALPFTTPHMLRGWQRGDADPRVAILPEDGAPG